MTEQTAPVSEFKDRSAGLIGFGVLVLIVALFCALTVAMMLVGQLLVPRTSPNPAQGSVYLAAAMYASMAVALGWLGIGSIMARRWARTLLLLLGWGWLIVGLVTMPMMPLMLRQPPPTSGAAPLPPAVWSMVVVTAMVFGTVFFIVLPGLLVLFYGSRNTKATCEARDPVKRWTDACPLPVLAASLFAGFGAFSLLLMIGSPFLLAPLFGRFLTGSAAVALFVAYAAMLGYCAWALYRLRPFGWWLTTATYCFFLVSSTSTFFLQSDLVEVYRVAGMPADQLELLRGSPVFQGKFLAWATGGSGVVLLGCLLYVKAVLNKASARGEAAL